MRIQLSNRLAEVSAWGVECIQQTAGNDDTCEVMLSSGETLTAHEKWNVLVARWRNARLEEALRLNDMGPRLYAKGLADDGAAGQVD